VSATSALGASPLGVAKGDKIKLLLLEAGAQLHATQAPAGSLDDLQETLGETRICERWGAAPLQRHQSTLGRQGMVQAMRDKVRYASSEDVLRAAMRPPAPPQAALEAIPRAAQPAGSLPWTSGALLGGGTPLGAGPVDSPMLPHLHQDSARGSSSDVRLRVSNEPAAKPHSEDSSSQSLDRRRAPKTAQTTTTAR